MNVFKLLALVPAGLALTACQTLGSSHAGLLTGKVRADAGVTGPFVINVIDRDTGHIAHRAFLEKAGSFDLILEGGNYKFLAFADLDRDGKLGSHEPASIRMTLSTTVRPGDAIELPTMQVRPRAVGPVGSG
jgi:hypothetical protein